MINVDEQEDFLDLRDRELKAQIRESHEQYRRGKARDARELLAVLRSASAKSKK